jgi:hypothetical protein
MWSLDGPVKGSTACVLWFLSDRGLAMSLTPPLEPLEAPAGGCEDVRPCI